MDERSTDNFAYSDRGRKTPTHSNNLSRSKISARVSPFNQPPVPVSPSSSMSAQIEHTSWAASSSSPHSSHERTLIPPPNKPRPYAPGLAMRKAKTDEYDPFSRLVPIDNYTLMKEKEDAKVLDTWTTIDPDTKTRSWDRQITEERSRLGSTEGLQRTESWSLPSSSWNAASVMSSGQGSSHGGWATSERGGNGNYPSEYSVDRRFENPTLDVDPEVRVSQKP